MDEKYYIDNLTKYSNTINLALKVSRRSAGRQVEDKKVWACVLYTKICVTGLSIFILAPNSEIAEKKITHWDFSSLFSLTRNLMECYHTLFYLCVDNVSDDELEARRKLFNLHDYYSRKKLFSFTDDNQEDKKIEDSIIDELTKTNYFKSLGEKQQKHFLKGENAFFISREDIEEKTGTDKNDFKLLYKLFSSNTHSFPMGFYGMLEGERGTGVKSEIEIGYNGLALETAEQYIGQATKNMLDFFPDIILELTEIEKINLE
ncbi:MAG: DUF5677 domain-containing protein [Candidatus Shapirobacteria bacterium]